MDLKQLVVQALADGWHAEELGYHLEVTSRSIRKWRADASEVPAKHLGALRSATPGGLRRVRAILHRAPCR